MKTGGSRDQGFDVLVIGRSCMDMIAVLERLPHENQKVPIEYRMREGGGQGGTAACCISRLGGRAVYAGKLGDDAAGRFCRERLEAFMVDTRFVETVAGGVTPIAFVFITRSSGARTIVYEPSRLPRIALTQPLRELIRRAPIILLDPETTYLAKDIAGLKRKRGKIVYDCERRRDGLDAMMALADYFIPSSDFLEDAELSLGGRSLEEKLIALKKQVAGEVVVTCGERGACWHQQGRLLQVKPPKIRIVDTLGAGDNFHAAFALAMSRGMDLKGAVCFATSVATLSCRDYGGRKGLPDWDKAAGLAAELTVERLV
jgi:sulfofructose kinase